MAAGDDAAEVTCSRRQKEEVLAELRPVLEPLLEKERIPWSYVAPLTLKELQSALADPEDFVAQMLAGFEVPWAEKHPEIQATLETYAVAWQRACTCPACCNAHDKRAAINGLYSLLANACPATPLAELFGDAQIVGGPERKTVPVRELSQRLVGLYFSADWCGPCKQFTPVLQDLYNHLRALGDDQLEVVYISSDHEQAEFDSYYSEMPWLALRYDQADVVGAIGDSPRLKHSGRLRDHFGVWGIPGFVLLDGCTGEVILGAEEGAVAVLQATASGGIKQLRQYRGQEKAEKERVVELVEKMPELLTCEHHPHPLRKLSAHFRNGRDYTCALCGTQGEGWGYHSEVKDWAVHPLCACIDPLLIKAEGTSYCFHTASFGMAYSMQAKDFLGWELVRFENDELPADIRSAEDVAEWVRFREPRAYGFCCVDNFSATPTFVSALVGEQGARTAQHESNLSIYIYDSDQSQKHQAQRSPRAEAWEQLQRSQVEVAARLRRVVDSMPEVLTSQHHAETLQKVASAEVFGEASARAWQCNVCQGQGGDWLYRPESDDGTGLWHAHPQCLHADLADWGLRICNAGKCELLEQSNL